MDGSVLSINSRATAIKTILLTAWRCKLSQESWECRIKKVLPKGVNGDVYDLADCILKQALVGPVPNLLFMSYLKHAVQCELVSHGAVLTTIANQPIYLKLSNLAPNRTSSIVCLVEFLKSFRDNICCSGNEIECLNLCNSISQLIHWLLKCIHHCVDILINPVNNNYQTHQNNQSQQAIPNVNSNSGIQNESILGIIDLCAETLQYFTNRPFTKSLLFIGKVEFSKEFDDIFRCVQIIQQKLMNHPNFHLINEKLVYFEALKQLVAVFTSSELHPSVAAAQQLRNLQTHRIRSTQVSATSNFEKNMQQSPQNYDSTTNYTLFNALYPLIAFDVCLRPARSHKNLARQITIITNFNSCPIHITYCELIRVCMIGLIDTDGTPAKVKWVFFTFLKLPKLLIELSKFKSSSTNGTFQNQSSIQNSNSNSEVTSLSNPNNVTIFINDLMSAFERLCEYSPLLDEAEYKCNCDLFKCLIRELIKNDINLAPLKSIDLRKFPSRRSFVNNNENPSIGGHMMLKTEPVVTSMLETFDTEQDPIELFAIISQLVSGKHFEFTLNAAASTGRLKIFVKKLVEHNELNKTPKVETSKNSGQIQALIFDITFLILTYIAQQYGPEVIGTNQQSTFIRWFYECYNNGTRINCPMQMLKNCNDEIVTRLIRQLLSADDGIKMRAVNWSEVCFNIPKVIYEIILAWNQGYLEDNQIVMIIQKIKSKMCFLAVVVATWLQCYIKTLSETDKTKPLFILQNLTRASQQARQQKQNSQFNNSTETSLKNENYPERSSLMCSIIRKIYFEIVPKIGQNIQNTSANANNSSHAGNVSLNNTYSSMDFDESVDESAYQSINEKFISILSTQEILLANVKQCLNRGWIDHKSLNSLNSLFKIIGGESFTNLIVDRILTSHESPKDLSRAVNITFGLFHLDLEACAFALLKTTLPNWLMGEKKQILLNQPRAFALAQLTVMTIIEVFTNLESNKLNSYDNKNINNTNSNNSFGADRKFLSNGIKQEPGILQRDEVSINLNGSNDLKRIKLMNEFNENDNSQQDIDERLNSLSNSVSDLMRLFSEIMSDPVMSQRTLFPILFLQQTVVCTRERATIITVHLQPEILLDIINLFSSELTFELVLAISNLSTTNGRKYAAKAMCKLAQVKEFKQSGLTATAAITNNHGQGFNDSRGVSVSNQASSNNNGTSRQSTSHSPMIIG